MPLNKKLSFDTITVTESGTPSVNQLAASLPPGTQVRTLVAATVNTTDAYELLKLFVDKFPWDAPTTIPTKTIFGIHCNRRFHVGVQALVRTIVQNGGIATIYLLGNEMSEFQIYKKLIEENPIARRENTWVSLVGGGDLVHLHRGMLTEMTLYVLKGDNVIDTAVGFQFGGIIDSEPVISRGNVVHLSHVETEKLPMRNLFLRGSLFAEFFSWATDTLLDMTFPWYHIISFVKDVKKETRFLYSAPDDLDVLASSWTYFCRPGREFNDTPVKDPLSERHREAFPYFEHVFKVVVSYIHRYIKTYKDMSGFFRHFAHELTQKSLLRQELLMHVSHVFTIYAIFYLSALEEKLPSFYRGTSAEFEALVSRRPVDCVDMRGEKKK